MFRARVQSCGCAPPPASRTGTRRPSRFPKVTELRSVHDLTEIYKSCFHVTVKLVSFYLFWTCALSAGVSLENLLLAMLYVPVFSAESCNVVTNFSCLTIKCPYLAISSEILLFFYLFVLVNRRLLMQHDYCWESVKSKISDRNLSV